MKQVVFLLLFTVITACGGREQSAPAQQSVPAAPREGKAFEGEKIVMNYGCNVCHVIPGTEGPQGSIGPSLAGIAERPTISEAKIENTPDNLAQFVQNPKSLHPQSSMPPTGLSDPEAEAVAEFLMTLK